MTNIRSDSAQSSAHHELELVVEAWPFLLPACLRFTHKCLVPLQVRVGALIAQGDLERLLEQARGFVDKGFRVKLVVRFGHWQRQNGESRIKAVIEEVGLGTMAGCVQGDRVFLPSKPLYPLVHA